MSITYGQAKEILSKYVGTGGVCSDNPQVDQFTREVLDYLLISGTYGNEHKFCFCAVKGCITVPHELETPLKIKIGDRVGTVWDRWFEFHPTKYLSQCIPCANALTEDPNYYPTVYDIPSHGARLGVIGTCCEEDGAHVIFKGTDPTGREIFTTHNGEQIVGEYVSIKKNTLIYTNAMFGKVTAVVKPKTKGYVQCYWAHPGLNLKGFLADYSPLDENPQYRRFRLTKSECQSGNVKVEILGRVRLKPYYVDNDLIPFDNIYLLNIAGQVVNANYNNAPDLAAMKEKTLTSLVEMENDHKKINNGNPIEFYIPTSAGAIKNII